MVTRAAVAFAAALSGCGGGGGQHYELRVHPTAAARADGKHLAIILTRTDSGETAAVDVALPSPTPAPPWTLDVQTGAWGEAPITASVEARGDAGAIARGSGAPVGAVIDVTLADVVTAGDGGTDSGADAAAPDLSMPDLAPPPDLQCPVTTLSIPAQADTIIGPGAPNLNFGGGHTCNVGVGIGSNGLFRFSVAALPQNAKVQSMRLVLTFAQHSTDCANNCGPCSFDASGAIGVFWMRNDWKENTATWNVRDTNLAWGAPGASQGQIDRSGMPIVVAQHVAQTSMAIDLPPAAFADLATWRSNDQVSFELTASNGAVFVIASKESVQEACAMFAGPVLEIGYCP